jgi:subfamily B ATP-binding cassette protein MsbA
MKVYKKLLKLVKPYWFKLLIAMICMVMLGFSTSSLAFLVKPVFDDIFNEKNITMLKLMPLAIIGIFVLKGICFYYQFYLMGYIGQKIITDLRNKLYEHIQSLSLSFFNKTPTGVIMSRIINDVSLIQGAVSNAVASVLRDSFAIVGLTFVAFYRDWKLALIAILIFPLAVVSIVKFGKKLRRVSTQSQSTMGDLSTLLYETISGNRIVKAFGMEDYENERFSKENDRLFHITMKSYMVRSLSTPVMEILASIGIATVIWYGGYSVIIGGKTPGSFFSFMAAVFMLYDPVKKIISVNNVIQEGIAASIRVFSLLDMEPEIKDSPHAKPLPLVNDSIEFRNVSFKYSNENEYVLKNINFKVKKGEVVAFVGESGSGKTTLINLIPRFYDVTEGEVLIDGINIKDVTVESLRAQIGMVTQEIVLFNDTVKNNIAYGDINKSYEEIVEAAKAAYAHHFIINLPNGYDTVIGEKGVMLSGGERQRIAIARAILKNAPILILDEATSSLDSGSELEVQKALDNLMEGRTTFVIAHRLSTVRRADRIFVLLNGRIIEEGRHEDLMKFKGEYRRLYDMQFIETREVTPLI